MTPGTFPAVIPPSDIIRALPGVSPLEARLATLAQSLGFRLQPAMYSATFRAAARPGTAELQTQTQDGVFFITRIVGDAASLVSGGEASLDIQVGSKKYGAGAIRLADFLAASGAAWGEGALTAPVVMRRKDTLQLTVRPNDDGETVVVGAGFHVAGYHVRTADLDRVDRQTGDDFADVVANEGELWMVGLIGNTAGLLQSVNEPIVVERWMLATDTAGEGEADATRMRVSLGNIQVTPSADGVDAGVIRSLGGRVWMDGIAMAMESSTMLQFDPAYPTTNDTAVQSRCLLIGRAPRG